MFKLKNFTFMLIFILLSCASPKMEKIVAFDFIHGALTEKQFEELYNVKILLDGDFGEMGSDTGPAQGGNVGPGHHSGDAGTFSNPRADQSAMAATGSRYGGMGAHNGFGDDVSEGGAGAAQKAANAAAQGGISGNDIGAAQGGWGAAQKAANAAALGGISGERVIEYKKD